MVRKLNACLDSADAWIKNHKKAVDRFLLVMAVLAIAGILNISSTLTDEDISKFLKPAPAWMHHTKP